MFVFNFLFVAKIANSSETSKFNIVNRYQRNDEYLTYSSFCRMESSLTTDIHWCSHQFKRFRDISTFEIVL